MSSTECNAAPVMRVNTRYNKLHEKYILKRDAPCGTHQAHSATQVCKGIRQNQFWFMTGHCPLISKLALHTNTRIHTFTCYPFTNCKFTFTSCLNNQLLAFYVSKLTHTHARTHARTHTHTQKKTRTRAHTHTHTHTHKVKKSPDKGKSPQCFGSAFFCGILIALR